MTENCELQQYRLLMKHPFNDNRSSFVIQSIFHLNTCCWITNSTARMCTLQNYLCDHDYVLYPILIPWDVQDLYLSGWCQSQHCLHMEIQCVDSGNQHNRDTCTNTSNLNHNTIAIAISLGLQMVAAWYSVNSCRNHLWILNNDIFVGGSNYCLWFGLAFTFLLLLFDGTIDRPYTVLFMVFSINDWCAWRPCRWCFPPLTCGYPCYLSYQLFEKVNHTLPWFFDAWLAHVLYLANCMLFCCWSRCNTW